MEREPTWGDPAEGFALPPSGFFHSLARRNGLEGSAFGGWIFPPGTGFGETEAWWREGTRAHPHEGVDVFLYADAAGGRGRLPAGAVVPPVWEGVVVRVVPDHLGKTVFVAHHRCGRRGRRLHSVYGHLVPGEGIAPGLPVAADHLLGRVADTAGRRVPMAPHLHLSLALVDASVRPGDLGWDLMRDPRSVTLLDPRGIGGPRGG
jgi:hypothetical protein